MFGHHVKHCESCILSASVCFNWTLYSGSSLSAVDEAKGLLTTPSMHLASIDFKAAGRKAFKVLAPGFFARGMMVDTFHDFWYSAAI